MRRAAFSALALLLGNDLPLMEIRDVRRTYPETPAPASPSRAGGIMPHIGKKQIEKARRRMVCSCGHTRAAYYVKREFERDTLVPDIHKPGSMTFKAHGISFAFLSPPPNPEAK